ncbi:MAG: DUF3429 domain-containing protein [Roseicyclus sp.]
MTRIPAPALILGLSGLLPFLWGALTAHLPGLAPAWLPARFSGGLVLQGYGIVILSFMAGVIWGFGTRAARRQATLFYVVSVMPPLWAFFAATGAVGPSLAALLAGFVALLAVDYAAARAGLAPEWWMALRLLLTGVVALCLILGLWAGP